jgi:hypothetical protein
VRLHHQVGVVQHRKPVHWENRYLIFNLVYLSQYHKEEL